MDAMSLIIDARPEKGAWLAVDINTGGHYRQAALFDSSVSGIRAVAIPPNRTGGLKVRLRGCGRCPVYSIERTFRSGSEAR